MDLSNFVTENYDLELNEQQQKAVFKINGPVLLLAVPGAGKTTVIVARCANMIFNHQILPENILSLTFSRASAKDMKSRFQKYFGYTKEVNIQFATIHSFCYSVLRIYYQRKKLRVPQLLEGNNSFLSKNQMLRKIYTRFNNEYLGDDLLEELSNAIGYVKNMLYTREQIDAFKTNIKNFPEIFMTYEEQKQLHKCIDFDDMLVQTLKIFDQEQDFLNMYRHKYQYINVDEAQDLSYLQHEIIKRLAYSLKNIFMVGDEDQSIYAFRGAYPQVLLNFEAIYPGAQVYFLERNYRSTKSIVEVANGFIQVNKERRDKKMFTERTDGRPIKIRYLANKEEQLEYLLSLLQQGDFYLDQAVLYRNNVSSLPIIDLLDRNKIRFYLREFRNSPFKHWVINDLVSFLKFSLNPADLEAFKHIYYKMDAFISRVMFEQAIRSNLSNNNLIYTLLDLPGIYEKTQKKLVERNYTLQKMAQMKPLEAIEAVEKDLGYIKFLKRISKSEGYTFENLVQNIESLKSIASHTETIDQFLRRLEELEAMIEDSKYNRGKNAVTLSTIHSSKGLEFKQVVIVDLVDGQFPSGFSIDEAKKGDPHPMEEETRLFYVGITRAKEELELLTVNTINNLPVKPSRFLNQVLKLQFDTDQYLDSGEKIIGEGISIGDTVIHRKFGRGIVCGLDMKADLVEIDFNKVGSKTFSLKICLENGLLTRTKNK